MRVHQQEVDVAAKLFLWPQWLDPNFGMILQEVHLEPAIAPIRFLLWGQTAHKVILHLLGRDDYATNPSLQAAKTSDWPLLVSVRSQPVDGSAYELLHLQSMRARLARLPASVSARSDYFYPPTHQ